MSQLPTPRRIIIGDVHGHYLGLMALLEAIAPGAEDQVYFLGDLIDRGPQSAQVVNFVKNSPYRCVLGNHEHLLLEAFPDGKPFNPALQGWLASGGSATVTSYTSVEALLADVEWIRTLPLYLDLGDLWLVHAGVHPELTLDEQGYKQFCWIRNEFHQTEQPYFADKLIITGHTITFNFPNVMPGAIVQGQGWLDIDTGAYHPKSGWLTGLDVTQGVVYQTNVYTNELRRLPLAEVITHSESSKPSKSKGLRQRVFL